jgi:hypothetical protein
VNLQSSAESKKIERGAGAANPQNLQSSAARALALPPPVPTAEEVDFTRDDIPTDSEEMSRPHGEYYDISKADSPREMRKPTETLADRLCKEYQCLQEPLLDCLNQKFPGGLPDEIWSPYNIFDDTADLEGHQCKPQDNRKGSASNINAISATNNRKGRVRNINAAGATLAAIGLAASATGLGSSTNSVSFEKARAMEQLLLAQQHVNALEEEHPNFQQERDRLRQFAIKHEDLMRRSLPASITTPSATNSGYALGDLLRLR